MLLCLCMKYKYIVCSNILYIQFCTRLNILDIFGSFEETCRHVHASPVRNSVKKAARKCTREVEEWVSCSSFGGQCTLVRSAAFC